MKNTAVTISEKLKWLILLRLLLTTIFFVVGNLVFAIEKVNFYLIIAGIYLISLIYLLWLAQKRFLMGLAVVQIVIDIAIETVVIGVTGGIESLFIVLYVLSILSASLVISAPAGIGAAAGISVVYTTCNMLNVWGKVSFFQTSAGKRHALDVVLYSSYVHVITFILVSVLISSLIKRLHHMESMVRVKEHLAVVGEVSAEIAHEIRNPLTAISGSVELLQERVGAALPEDDRVLMQAIVDESDRVSTVFEQFLDYARVADIQREAVFLPAVIDDVVVLYEHNQRIAKDVTFVRNYGPDTGMIVGDTNKIRQVFRNIIHNALEAIPEQGTITIALAEAEDGVEVTVRDTGRGIEKNILKRMFEPYASGKTSGMGIGLAIAQKIVEMHRGRIRVESAVGTGTTFRVYLPKE